MVFWYDIQMDPQQEITHEPKKKKIIIAASILSVIIVLLFGGYILFFRDKDETSKLSSQQSSSADTEQSVVSTENTKDSATIVNTWDGAKVDPKKLPIGDKYVTTKSAAKGKLYACSAGNPNAGGASADGPWINNADGTWDSTTKLAVKGEVSWPSAKYSETVDGGKRTLISNNLPVEYMTGTFPIASTDPSYAYDRNPGTITSTDTVVVIAENGTVAASPSCLPEGAIGMLKNGVVIFSSVDGRGEDAVAHESQDLCDGHPAQTEYHYHNVPSCILNASAGPSTIVGWMSDGFPIVVERDVNQALPTNADLDECHGRTSPVLVDGTIVSMYHYSATLEFPYFAGCFKGTPIKITSH